MTLTTGVCLAEVVTSGCFGVSVILTAGVVLAVLVTGDCFLVSVILTSDCSVVAVGWDLTVVVSSSTGLKLVCLMDGTVFVPCFGVWVVISSLKSPLDSPFDSPLPSPLPSISLVVVTGVAVVVSITET